MAGRKVFGWRLIVAGVVVSAAAWEMAERRRLSERRDRDAAEPTPHEPALAAVHIAKPPHTRRLRRFATSVVLASLFFACAAFTAGAGNQTVQADDAIAADAPGAVSVDPPPAPDAAPTAAPAAADPVSEPDPSSPPPAPEVVPESTTEAAPSPPADAGADPTPATAPPAAAASAGSAQSEPAPLGNASQPRRPASRPAARRAPVPTPVPAAAPVLFPTVPFDLQAWEHDNPASPLGATAVAIAMHYVGTPYVWGGAGPAAGFDCSGFTMYVYAQLGIALPHYAASQFAAFAKLASFDLEPGDLVFFEPRGDGPGHVAIYAGNDTIIEAPHTGALVRTGSLSGSTAALGFLGAVRPYAAAEASTRQMFAFLPAAAPERHSGIGTVGQVYAV